MRIQTSVVQLKTCNKCGKEKPVDEFEKKVGGRLGVAAVCKACRKEWYNNDYMKRPYAIENMRNRSRKHVAKKHEEFKRVVLPETKRCCHCKTVKPVTEFYKCYGNSDFHHIRCKVCSLQHSRETAQKLRFEVINHYGGKCACCGESAIQFLSIDHINGGGRQELLASKSASICRYLKKMKFPKDGYRVLCFNCNCALGFYGFCHGNFK